VIRAIASAGAICIGAALLGALAGGVLAQQTGAELGLIAGGVFGLALGVRYYVDMAEVAAAQRDWDDAYSLKQGSKQPRGKQDGYNTVSSSRYLRNKRGEIWTEVLAKRRERLTGAPHARYTSQRHHDLDLSDIGIRRKRKPKRR